MTAILLLILAFIACGIVCIPILKLSRTALSLGIGIIVTSGALYGTYGHYGKQQQWEQRGKQHYHLQVQLQRLGGYEGLEQRLQAYLDNHPNDQKATELLHKIHSLNNKTS